MASSIYLEISVLILSSPQIPHAPSFVPHGHFRMQHSACEKIRAHPLRRLRDLCFAHQSAWHLCSSVASVGNINHPACSLAPLAHKSLPQISQISTDFVWGNSQTARAESPTSSLAQGKRSDTLGGKPQRHATPCKGKSKHNWLSFSTFAITGCLAAFPFYPGRGFACRWAMSFCPFRGVPLWPLVTPTDLSDFHRCIALSAC